MTASTESSVAADRGDGPLSASWREARLRAQEAALPAGRVVVSCSAPLGAGGLGRHLRRSSMRSSARGQSGRLHLRLLARRASASACALGRPRASARA